MYVESILKGKGANIISVKPADTVADTAKVLARHRIGAVLVCDGDGDGELAGILSERDIVRGLAETGSAILEGPVSALMTRRVVTCSPGDSVDGVMAKMTEGRFRHLPVMSGGSLVGVISIGDVVKERIAETEHEAEALKAYIATG